VAVVVRSSLRFRQSSGVLDDWEANVDGFAGRLLTRAGRGQEFEGEQGKPGEAVSWGTATAQVRGAVGRWCDGFADRVPVVRAARFGRRFVHQFYVESGGRADCGESPWPIADGRPGSRSERLRSLSGAWITPRAVLTWSEGPRSRVRWLAAQ